ncbi:hypothetical protein D6D01_04689 [Aureobasidium pullulans]|uniref:Phytanoyl-CoA dioxygenase family protein n=1 Tax=Aureobasidium pullulans TaxID=5580 RepID=A0A4S9L9N2_AURPU|nr:hypothetical protein D6D01_04689 [Aureobasidium pullulans]
MIFLRHVARVRPSAASRYISLGIYGKPVRNLSSMPVTVPVTGEEVVAKKLGWRNLELATRALHRDGLVVLQDAIAHSRLDALDKTMVQDALKLQAQGDAGPFNYNKGTEVWLGTHNTTSLAAQEGKQGDRASGRIAKDLLEERRQQRPPSQPLVRKGSIVIRDLRLWHAGKPNFSNDIRVMLAMIHFAPWYRNAMKVEFSEDLEAVLDRDGSGLQIQKTLVSEQTILDEYLNRGYGNSYNFDQESRLENF